MDFIQQSNEQKKINAIVNATASNLEAIVYTNGFNTIGKEVKQGLGGKTPQQYVRSLLTHGKRLKDIATEIEAGGKTPLYNSADAKTKGKIKSYLNDRFNNSTVVPSLATFDVLTGTSSTLYEKPLSESISAQEIGANVTRNAGAATLAIVGLTTSGQASLTSPQGFNNAGSGLVSSKGSFKIETDLRLIQEAVMTYSIDVSTLNVINTIEGKLAQLTRILTEMASNAVTQVYIRANDYFCFGLPNDSATNTIRSYGLFTDSLYYTEGGQSFNPGTSAAYNAQISGGTWGGNSSTMFTDLVKAVSILSSISGSPPTVIALPANARTAGATPTTINGTPISNNPIDLIVSHCEKTYGRVPLIVYNTILNANPSGRNTVNQAFVMNGETDNYSHGIAGSLQQEIIPLGSSITTTLRLPTAGLCQKRKNAFVRISNPAIS